jgi:hypothetical protein
MVLSRIWSAFIIIAIAIASIKYISSSNYKTIFNDMVVGKGGDTVKVVSQPMNTLSPVVKDSLMKKMILQTAEFIIKQIL